jgi:hypothetical protein
VILLAHNCSLLRIPFDSARLFGEPWSDYHIALSMTCDAVSDTNRREQARMDARMPK